VALRIRFRGRAVRLWTAAPSRSWRSSREIRFPVSLSFANICKYLQGSGASRIMPSLRETVKFPSTRSPAPPPPMFFRSPTPFQLITRLLITPVNPETGNDPAPSSPLQVNPAQYRSSPSHLFSRSIQLGLSFSSSSSSSPSSFQIVNAPRQLASIECEMGR
jgi:hypothetical protein